MKQSDVRLPELTETPKDLDDCRVYVRSVINENAERFKKQGRVYDGQHGLSDDVLYGQIRVCVRAALGVLAGHVYDQTGEAHSAATAEFLSAMVLSSPHLMSSSHFEGTVAQCAFAALMRHLHDVAGARINEVLDAHEPTRNTAALTYADCVAHARMLVRDAFCEHQRGGDGPSAFSEACDAGAVARTTVRDLNIGRDEVVSVLRSEPTLWNGDTESPLNTIRRSILDVIERRLVEAAVDEMRACEGEAAEARVAAVPAP